jgi:ethanolamine utilization microcompartment shell protein EutS
MTWDFNRRFAMSEETKTKEISHKLDTLIKLIAYQIVGKMTVSEAAPLLRRLGLTPSEIAAIYGSTAKAVSVRLAEANRKKKDRVKVG